MLFAFLCALIVPFVALSTSVDPGVVVPGVVLRNSNYQRWAHYSWVWLHNGLGNQQNVYDLVKGYKDNKIPFGAVNIDSTWATQFNNFEVNTDKFPDFPKLIADLHADNLRVILWATSMVNVENPDYDMCVANNYLVRDVRGKVFPLHWWHGDGGLLDYTNPEAVKWWHSKMDAVLNVGVDGFKCDGTDPYINEYILTGGAYGYNNTKITYREYADSYYGDFFDYTRQKRGDAGLIMSRPTDCLVDPVSKVCTNFSPKRVMYSGWVGDDDATFNGLRGCARKAIFSAWNGYASYGCDVGGYRGSDDGPNKQLFIRWAQYGAFLPLMENGGGGEHRPWMYDEETVAIYRKFAIEHHRLAPYLMTSTTNAIANGVSTITPLAVRPDIPLYKVSQPSTYNYLLGPDVLVHPAMADLPLVNSTFATIVDAQFPEGSEWMDWWEPSDKSLIRQGGSRALILVPITSASVFVRRGSMLPLERSVEDHSVMFTWFGPVAGQEVQADSLESISIGFGLRGTAALSAIDASNPSSVSTLSATVSSHTGSAGIEIVGITEPSNIQIDAGIHTAGCAHRYNEQKATLSVFCNSVAAGFKVSATGVSSTL